MNILIIEDEPKLAASLQAALMEEGHQAQIAPDGEQGLTAGLTGRFDLLILDRLLPGMDGISVCREVRRVLPQLPILMLTARSAVADRVDGLRSGADDYLTKPFALDELLARVQALERRGAAAARLIVGDLTLDPISHAAMRAGREITLSQREYTLLHFLMSHAGRIVSREQIAEHVWGLEFDYGTNVVDVYVGYLRRKIDQGHSVKLLQTIRGFGYSLRGGDHDRSEPPRS